MYSLTFLFHSSTHRFYLSTLSTCSLIPLIYLPALWLIFVTLVIRLLVHSVGHMIPSVYLMCHLHIVLVRAGIEEDSSHWYLLDIHILVPFQDEIQTDASIHVEMSLHFLHISLLAGNPRLIVQPQMAWDGEFFAIQWTFCGENCRRWVKMIEKKQRWCRQRASAVVAVLTRSGKCAGQRGARSHCLPSMMAAPEADAGVYTVPSFQHATHTRGIIVSLTWSETKINSSPTHCL